jgi:probable HAF family extracellular repeat protein
MSNTSSGENTRNAILGTGSAISALVACALLANCSGGSAVNRELPPLPATQSATHALNPAIASLHYRFVDLGTFGGPSSYFIFTGQRDLNNHGDAVGNADTSTPDPFYPFCFVSECVVTLGFITDGNGLQNLGALQDGSIPAGVNEKRTVGLDSQNGQTDPFTGIFELRAVLWERGNLHDLGTFGGYYGYTNDINNKDEQTGFATNGVSDPYPLGNFCNNFPMGEQMHALLSRRTVAKDIGTLGGPDSCGEHLNQAGDVAGQSYINNYPNSSTGFPTQDPFLYKSGKMTDLGTLGGVVGTSAAVNDSGEVAGTSDLVGDATAHAFSWRNGHLRDLGTLGGANSGSDWMNNAGHVVGSADLASSGIHHAFLWTHDAMKDLGTQDGDPCSHAVAVNSKDQVVGGSSDCHTFLHAFLWQKGTMIDLNSFVPSSSNVVLTQGTAINERGEITAQGVLPDGSSHAVLLIPCGERAAECDSARSNVRHSLAARPNSRTMPWIASRMLQDRYSLLDALHRSKRR